MNYIDYTQYKAFTGKCEWYWYERFVKGYQKKYTGQRSDGMAFGSLVHGGVENWTTHRLPEIPQTVVDEINPTPECYTQAAGMVLDYTRSYPNEEWEIFKTEQPLLFRLDATNVESNEVLYDKICGLAKVDAYFFNPEPREVETGIPGYTITLEPGWWIREYKTKAASKNRANWMKQWQVNMQASFQILALRAYLNSVNSVMPIGGILVQVLERDTPYVPKRKCGGCAEMLPLSAYLAAGAGEYACPLCGKAQKLKPYEPKLKNTSAFYRVKVSRTAEELERDHLIISDVAFLMEEIRVNGKDVISPRLESCVDPWYGACEFFNVHIKGLDLEEDVGLEKADTNRYTGLVQFETAKSETNQTGETVVELIPEPIEIKGLLVAPGVESIVEDSKEYKGSAILPSSYEEVEFFDPVQSMYEMTLEVEEGQRCGGD